MQIAHSLESRLTDRPTVLTIGKFDGVHLGHQRLVRTAVARARELGCLSAVLTFEPHPDVVIRPERELYLLTSLDERSELLGQLGPDLLVVAPFSRETMSTPAAEYMRRICAALPLRELWVGSDFALGRGREGNVPRLQEIGQDLGYTVGTVDAVELAGAPVSASRARQCLYAGDVQGVIPLLGRPFWIRGPVEEGDRRGQTIGYPTANIAVAPVHALPADGVYACQVYLDAEPLPAVTNVGTRPTFAGTRRTVEAHLLDWQGNLYGQTVRLEFLHHLRGEQKFSGIDELVAQIGRDAQRARELLRGEA